MATIGSSPTGGNHNARLFRYAQNLYFEDGLLLTGLLAALLFCVAAVTLAAAGSVADIRLLLPVTAGALCMSLLMAYSRFDNFYAFSHGMVTSLAWILYLMSHEVTAAERQRFIEYGFPPLQASVNTVLLHLLRWAKLMPLPQADTNRYMSIFALCFLLWWLTYLGIWSIFRHGYTWRAIVPVGVVLLLSSTYSSQPTAPFLLLFAIIAMLLLARTNLAEQQIRWRLRQAHVSQTIAPDVMRVGMGYIVLVLCGALLAPGLGRSPMVQEFLHEPLARVQAVVDRIEGSITPQSQSENPAGAFGSSLRLGGARNIDDQLVFTVNTPSGRYWRAVVFDTFDGRQWLNTTGSQMELAAHSSYPVAAWQQREPVPQTIVLYSNMLNIIGAADIRWVDLPVTAQVAPVTTAPVSPVVSRRAPDPDEHTSTDVGPIELTLIHAQQQLPAGTIYTVISNQSTATAEMLRAASRIYPLDVTEQYLQLPPDFSRRARELAQAIVATATSPTVYDQAKAIETYLRQIPYNDAIPAPAPTVDPVEYFLFDQQEGYCDYYATAMATMLRSVGIPARIASGYAEGRRITAPVAPGSSETTRYEVFARDAHTWVEVYFPAYGWIEFEPTAGESELQRQATALPQPTIPTVPTVAATATPSTSNALIVTPTSALTTTVTADTAAPLATPTSATTPSQSEQQWWLWVLATPLFLLFMLWSLRRTPWLAPTDFTAQQPPLFYERLLQWTARLGIAMPSHETPYEQGRRLGRWLPEGRIEIQQIIHAYVLYRFRPHPFAQSDATASPQTNQPLHRSWQRLEKVMRRIWMRRLYRKVTGG